MPRPLVLDPTEPPPATAPPGEEPFLTSAELATWLRIGDSTLRQWRKRGIGPEYITLKSGGIRYRPSAVYAWLGISRVAA